MSKQLLFIHTPLQRCGHNYLSKIIDKMVNISFFDYLEYESIMINHFALMDFEIKKNTTRAKETKIKELDYTVNQYRNNFLKNESFNYFLIKNTNFIYKSQIDLFKDDKHIILMRNPYDLFISYEKSLYNFRFKSIKNTIKLILRPVYSIYVALLIRKKLLSFFSEIKKIESEFIFIKYENLDDLYMQNTLLCYLKDSQIKELERTIHIANTNSSFAKKEKQWKEESSEKEIGNTKKRFENSSFLMKFIVKLIFFKVYKKYMKIV